MTAIWAGIDAGKTHHHCVVIDDTGKRLLSRRVANEESELVKLLGEVLDLGEVADPQPVRGARAGQYGIVRLRRLVGLQADRGTAASARPRCGCAVRPLAWTLGIPPGRRRRISQVGLHSARYQSALTRSGASPSWSRVLA